MEGTGIQPVMDMNRGYDDGFGFGGGGLWLFAILALMWGGNGLWGNRGNDSRCATVEDLNNSANFTRLESQVMNNGNRIENKADAVYGGICNLGYEMAQQFNSTNSKLADCCCENRLAIANTNAHLDQINSAINANTTAQVQKVLDMLYADKVSALQGRISQLELQQAVSGVVRYPSTFTYSAGQSPFCGGYCGCGNNLV
jgi:hypothetical protein|nr:MAG TPA: hypothetical protein [Bacteriophage sp.]